MQKVQKGTLKLGGGDTLPRIIVRRTNRVQNYNHNIQHTVKLQGVMCLFSLSPGANRNQSVSFSCFFFFLRQLSLKNHLYTGQTATYKHIHRHSRFFHTDSCKICCSYLIYMTKACTPNHGTANNRVMVHTPTLQKTLS